MMSAAAMSAIIRLKKKKMEEEHSDAVKLSGIPEDAQDIMVIKNKEPGEMLSENEPKEHDEMPTLASEMADEKAMQPHEEKAPGDEEDELLQRHMRMRSMMSRMRA